MDGYPKMLQRLMPNFIYAFASAAFFLVSVFLYRPVALCNLMRAGESSGFELYNFNISICFVIILASLLLSRLVFYFLRKVIDKSWWTYIFWCVLEIAVCSAFVGLYLVLTDRGQYTFFLYWWRSISCLGTVFIYPYIILSLLYVCLEKGSEAPLADDVRLKFYDNRHQLKFITERSSIVFLESDENYVNITYLENGVEKHFQLRNSMKNLEPLCEKAGFVRTHRRYIVNPDMVKSIRKDENGVHMADLGLASGKGVPISKPNYDSVSKLL